MLKKFLNVEPLNFDLFPINAINVEILNISISLVNLDFVTLVVKELLIFE